MADFFEAARRPELQVSTYDAGAGRTDRMRQLALKKRESRLLWQVLMRGIVATDRMNEKEATTDRDDYKKLRHKLIDAWRSGIIVGGVRPKHRIYDIMPDYILRETELAELKKLSMQKKAKSNRNIVVPKKAPAAQSAK